MTSTLISPTFSQISPSWFMTTFPTLHGTTSQHPVHGTASPTRCRPSSQTPIPLLATHKSRTCHIITTLTMPRRTTCYTRCLITSRLPVPRIPRPPRMSRLPAPPALQPQCYPQPLITLCLTLTHSLSNLRMHSATMHPSSRMTWAAIRVSSAPRRPLLMQDPPRYPVTRMWVFLLLTFTPILPRRSRSNRTNSPSQWRLPANFTNSSISPSRYMTRIVVRMRRARVSRTRRTCPRLRARAQCRFPTPRACVRGTCAVAVPEVAQRSVLGATRSTHNVPLVRQRRSLSPISPRRVEGGGSPPPPPCMAAMALRPRAPPLWG